jgi:serine phosphatase RsbU (regulator of sigma subunit)
MAEKEKILANQSQRQIQLIEIEKINSRKKAEIETLNVKNQLKETRLQNQRYLLYAIVVVLIMVIILVLVIYRNYRQKSAANNLLKKNKQELIDKNKRLSQLNEEINVQNEQIISQRDILARQNEKITDSIVFASLIQQALLPTNEILESNFKEYFIYNKPRDIVSGDFYWFKQFNNSIYIAIADGTGHGVPGAFMSTLGISLLNEVLGRNQIKSPDIVLEELRERLVGSMQQKVTNNNGMDMALCLIDRKANMLSYAGANIPHYLFRNGGLILIKPNKMPVGDHPHVNQKFTLHQIQLYPEDTLYIFTDGYVSQLGGRNNLKYSAKKLLELLANIQSSNLKTQSLVLESSSFEWRGNSDQIDDILALGLKF